MTVFEYRNKYHNNFYGNKRALTQHIPKLAKALVFSQGNEKGY